MNTRAPGLIAVLLLCSAARAQVLVVDRAVSQASPHASVMRLGLDDGISGFLGDHFQLGAKGQTWIVDTIRTWAAAPRDRAADLPRIGDFYRELSLFGGIESAPSAPGQPAEPECDCHNLLTLKTASLPAASGNAGNHDIGILADRTAGAWQIDFKNLHWSVPGGVPIQFGVRGTLRKTQSAAAGLHQLAGGDDSRHAIKVFDAKGKFLSAYEPGGKALDPLVGIYVQVWARRLASVMIRGSGNETIEAILRGDPSFDATKASPGSLRLGSKSAIPVETSLRDADGDGRLDLVARFRKIDTGIRPIDVTVCLTGELEGVPFEGCDLIKQMGQ